MREWENTVEFKAVTTSCYELLMTLVQTSLPVKALCCLLVVRAAHSMTSAACQLLLVLGHSWALLILLVLGARGAASCLH